MCGLRGDDLRAGRWADLAVSQFGWMGNNTADGDGNTSDQSTRDLHFVCPIERRARRSARGVSVMVRYMDTESIPSPGETRFCCTLHNARPGTTPLGASFSVTAAERDCESLDSAGFGSLLIEMP
jgi:hypothetical protein